MRAREHAEPSGFTFQHAVMIAFGVAAALLAGRSIFTPVTMASSLMVVPLLIGLVPWVAWLGGLGVYCWNKGSMAFELLDPADHPILVRVMPWFDAAFASFCAYTICAIRQ